ncbi:MAG: hypothetical protein IKA87_08615, partial [Lentisphaeria bacterium]|nr:hypothetical protein [Lentisphaeria bacterium]
MKKIILTVALSGTLFLGGAEWQLKSNNFDLRFSPKGGALTRLEYKGRLYTMPKQSSFTERALCNLPPDKQLSEQFGKLEFAKISSDSSSITFSAAGKKAFDWLRITKRYAVSGKGILEITYTLTNRSDVSKSAGIWIQTFLRRSSGTSLIPNIIYQLRNGKITELRHPGRVSSDEWSLDPRGDVAAVGAVDEKSGVLVKLPSGRSSAFYSWFHNESTLEFFLRQQRIDAGKSDEFKIVCSFPEDLKSALRRAAAGKTLPAKGEKLLLPYGFAGKKNIAVVEDAPPVMPETEKFMDVTVKKQFNPSIRSVLLPPGSDPEKVSVYPLANGNAEFDRPIDSTVQKLPNGRYRLLFAVPQLDPRGLIFVRIKKEGVF